MSLIEGIGDDVITILFLLFMLVIVIMAWLSTNVRDLPRPTNFYFIERNTGRLFTASNLDGNVHGNNIRTPQLYDSKKPSSFNRIFSNFKS